MENVIFLKNMSLFVNKEQVVKKKKEAVPTLVPASKTKSINPFCFRQNS
jgi:hypothetical protein